MSRGERGVDDDRIEKHIELRAPRARVWRAISRPDELAAWFGLGEQLVLEGELVPGARIEAVWTMGDKVSREPFCTVEEVVPERLLAIRWHPYELGEGEDPATHPTTRIEMRLEETPQGTRLTISESGFAALPPDKQYKRADNAEGWEVQLQSIAQHILGGVKVAVSERIARPIAEVFEAIADPARMSRYFISRGSGRMTEGARLTWAWDHAGGVEVTVDVKLVDAPRRIMYVWRAAGGRATKVVLALAADGDGATELTASEAPFALTEEAAAQAVGQTQGWTHFSLCLKAYLEHGVDLRSRRVA